MVLFKVFALNVEYYQIRVQFCHLFVQLVAQSLFQLNKTKWLECS